nr:MAG: hypothetical protein DIU78_06800 [Pseudomonadota bacterium]
MPALRAVRLSRRTPVRRLAPEFSRGADLPSAVCRAPVWLLDAWDHFAGPGAKRRSHARASGS